MAFIATFEDTYARLRQATSLLDFSCINTTSGDDATRCTSSDGLNLEKARSILAKGKQLLNRETLRELIRCLLCKQDQRSGKYVLRRWCHELGIPITPLGRPRKSMSPNASRAADLSSGTRPSSNAVSRPRTPLEKDGSLTPCPTQRSPLLGPGICNTKAETVDDDAETTAAIGESNQEYRRRISMLNAKAADPMTVTEDLPSEVSVRIFKDLDAHDSHHSCDTSECRKEPSASPVTESPLADLGRDFKHGEDCSSTPRVISHKALKTFLAPVVKSGSPSKQEKTGWVYAVSVHGYTESLVKIGYTACGVKERLQAIKRDHGLSLDHGTWFSFSHFSVPLLRRLERVVHAELAGFRRILQVGHGRNGPTEYFAVDLTTAEITIRSWIRRMEHLDFQVNSLIDSRLSNTLWKQHDALQADPQRASTADLDLQVSDEICHRKRQQFWANVFLDEIGGVKSALRAPPRFVGLICGLLACTAWMSSRVSPNGTMFLLLAGCLLRLDWPALHVAWLRWVACKT